MNMYRTGDIVGLTGKVRHDQNEDDAYVFVDVTGHHTSLMLVPENLTLIAPRIDIGERVRWTNDVTGTVRAVDGDKLWVLTGVGQYVTWPAKEVTIVPPKVEIEIDVEEVAEVTIETPLDGKVGSEEEA